MLAGGWPAISRRGRRALGRRSISFERLPFGNGGPAGRFKARIAPGPAAAMIAAGSRLRPAWEPAAALISFKAKRRRFAYVPAS